MLKAISCFALLFTVAAVPPQANAQVHPILDDLYDFQLWAAKTKGWFVVARENRTNALLDKWGPYNTENSAHHALFDFVENSLLGTGELLIPDNSYLVVEELEIDPDEYQFVLIGTFDRLRDAQFADSLLGDDTESQIRWKRIARRYQLAPTRKLPAVRRLDL